MIKKTSLIIVLAVLSTFPIISVEFDWGGAIQNITELTSVNDWKVTQGDSISFWADLEIVPLFNIKVATGYRFLYDNEEIFHIPEFNAFTFYGKKDLFSYQAGRFNLSDSNNNLFSVLLDGVQVSLEGEKVSFFSGAGFSGGIFNKNSTVLLTASDHDAVSNNALLASPRIIEYIEASFFIIPGDGSLTASFLAQQDMRSFNSLDEGYGNLHSFYLNLGLKGRIGSLLFYDFYLNGEIGTYHVSANATLSTSERSLLVLAGAGGLRLDLPLNVVLKPLFSLDLFYSTGDDWDRGDWQNSTIDSTKDSLNQYTPLTLNNKGYVYSNRIGNLFYGDFSVSIAPASFLSIKINSLTLFRSVDGPVSGIPVSQGASSLYLGEEIGLELNFRPLSDLGFQIKGAIFIPNDAVVSDGIQYKIGGFLSLSF